MLVTRLGGFSLAGALLIATPAVAQNDVKDCDWYCRIEKKINHLQEQINWITAHFFPEEKFHPPISTTTIGFPATKPPASVTKTFRTLSLTRSPSSLTFKPLYTPDSAILPLGTASSTSLNPPKPPRPIPSMGGGDGYKAVAYYTDWSIYARGYEPSKMPADKLTHVLYSFADNRDTGEVFFTDTWSDTDKHWPGDSWNDVGNNLYGGLKQMNLIKKKNRNLKLLLSIGGWTYAHEQRHFDIPASTSQGRKAFAQSCVNMIKNFGFDGIDIDWEYPQNPDQGNQLLLLLQEIRTAMDTYADTLAACCEIKPHFWLSIAAPAGEANYKNMPLGEIALVTDFINLMGYDYSGSWDKTSGHQANLYASNSCPSCTPFNTDKVVQDYVGNGVPPHKLVLGMPLYGRAFTNTKDIGQPYNGIGAPDQSAGSWEAGVYDFKSLPRPGAVEYYDKEADASYSYDISTQTLVSYDNVDMAKRKAAYIKRHNLGGGMWWELSGDKTGDESIVQNVVRELGGYDGGKIEQSPNWLTYPDSQYDNVKAGFPNE